jgi:hypothetical protein
MTARLGHEVFHFSMKEIIKPLAVSVLTLGFCVVVFVNAGCNKAPASKGELTLVELNRALSLMSTSPAGAPRTIDDLTNFPAFKGRPLPAMPAGKKLVINRALGKVVVVDQ